MTQKILKREFFMVKQSQIYKKKIILPFENKKFIMVGEELLSLVRFNYLIKHNIYFFFQFINTNMNSQIQCKMCTSWINQFDQCCPVCYTELKNHHYKGYEPEKQILLCKKCNFENDITNEICVACDAFLIQEKFNKKKCEICGEQVLEHIFDEHSTNCLLSMEQIQKYEQIQKNLKEEEEYAKNIKSCKYCKLAFPADLMVDHLAVCIKKKQVKPIVVSKPRPYISRPDKIKDKIKSDLSSEVLYDEPLLPADYDELKILEPSQLNRLTSLQQKAVLHMHKVSRDKHNKSLSSVQKKANKLGYNKHDLQNLAFYIENYAPIIIHIHITKHMEFFIKDTHYRSQFETNKSSGSLSRASRTQWEDRMFDKKYSKAKDFERVKYGVINFTNDPKGVNCALGYGISYFLLKEHVRPRCTMTDMDSSNSSSQIGTFKYCFHVIEKMNDQELKSAFKGAKALEQSSTVTTTYKQIQIHGPVQFQKDIQRIYVNKKQVQDKKYLDMVYTFSEKFKVPMQFI